MLHWRRIADNNASYGVILGYRIFLFKYHQRFDISASADEGTKEIVNLVHNTTYNATVRGFNEYGDGVASDELTFTTMGKYITTQILFKMTVANKMAAAH